MWPSANALGRQVLPATLFFAARRNRCQCSTPLHRTCQRRNIYVMGSGTGTDHSTCELAPQFSVVRATTNRVGISWMHCPGLAAPGVAGDSRQSERCISNSLPLQQMLAAASSQLEYDFVDSCFSRNRPSIQQSYLINVSLAIDRYHDEANKKEKTFIKEGTVKFSLCNPIFLHLHVSPSKATVVQV